MASSSSCTKWAFYSSRIHPVQSVPYLFISDIDAAGDPSELKKHGITHVYSFLGHENEIKREVRNMYLGATIFRRFYQLWDDTAVAPYLLGILERAQLQLELDCQLSRARILIHCQAGISRSASFVLYHMMKSHQMTYSTAHTLLKASRPAIQPNRGFYRELKQMSDDAETLRLLTAWETCHRVSNSLFDDPP